MTEAAQPSPEPGDSVLYCEHAGPETFERGGFHWFVLDPKNIPFARRPNGTVFHPKWIRLCDACFMKHGTDLGGTEIERKGGRHFRTAPVIAGDATWPDLEVTYEKKS